MYDTFFVDYENPKSKFCYKKLKKRLPHLQKIKYFSNYLKTLNKIANISQTEYFWALSSSCYYDEFNFEWEPIPWENNQLHAFCPNKQKDSETFLVNKHEFLRQYNKPIEKLEHYTDINWHTDQPVKKLSYDIFFIDYENSESANRFDELKKRIPSIQKTRFFGDYLQILKRVANISTTNKFWVISSQCDYSKFDFDWGPDYWEREQLHIFSSIKEKYTDTFLVNKIELLKQSSVTKLEHYNNIHWHTDQTIIRPIVNIFYIDYPEHNKKIKLNFNDLKKRFPYIQKIRFFGTYFETLLRIAKISNTNNFWITSSMCNYKKFNFNWKPRYWDDKNLHIFSSKKKIFGDTMYVNKHELIKQSKIPIKKLEQYSDIKWHITKNIKRHPLDIFYINYNWFGSLVSMDSVPENILKNYKGKINVVRFFDNYLKTLYRIARLSVTNHFWVTSSHCEYDNFDFEWGPKYWEDNQLHVFSSNKQKYGETFLVNKREFLNQFKNLKKLEHYKDINRHCASTIKREPYNAWFIDHGNPEANTQFKKLQKIFPEIRRTRFFDSYLGVFHKIVFCSSTQYVWVLSSICNYDNFDFEWGPKYWEDNQLHVFSSEDQKFGDTFLINKETLANQLYDTIDPLNIVFPIRDFNSITLKKLEYYRDINWHKKSKIKRLSYPTVYYGKNTSALETIKKYISKGYSYFWCINENAKIIKKPNYNPTLWEKPKLHVFKTSGDVLLVPHAARSVVSKQLYDYNNILYHDEQFSVPQPLDIVFISYGEKNANKNYNTLLMRTNKPIKRINGVKGMVNAYKKAALLSETDYFFAVFAKNEIHKNFKFDFQPDRLKEPTHYIFNSRNVVNGLEYGHAGVILYNTKLILESKEWGVDFVTSFANQSVPILSCMNNFNTSEYETWRTAFRECVKLQSKCIVNQNTVESNYRLKIWTTVAEGKYSEWCLRGANDGVEYAKSHKDMMRTCDREWLEKYFKDRYNSVQNPVLKTNLNT